MYLIYLIYLFYLMYLMYLRMQLYVYVICMYAWMSACLYVCTCACMYASMHVCLIEPMYKGMWVRRYLRIQYTVWWYRIQGHVMNVTQCTLMQWSWRNAMWIQWNVMKFEAVVTQRWAKWCAACLFVLQYVLHIP